MENKNSSEAEVKVNIQEDELQGSPQTQPTQPTPPQEPAHGKWVPIDPSELSFSISGAEGQPIQGPDGHIYCVGSSEPALAPVNSGANAIPRPSSIIQMPSIVQPISLVPYTSQNQPMLQYDPYSRPLPPEAPEGAPRYKKKPYRGLSLALMLVALLALVLPLVFAVSQGEALLCTGADLVKSLFQLAGVGDFSSTYYAETIEPMGSISQQMIERPYDTIAILGLPIIFAFILLFNIILIFKYLIKLIKGSSPRGFSILALGNILLSVSIIAILYGMSAGIDNATSIQTFLIGQTAIGYGLGILAAALLNLVLLILPFMAKKYAHILDVPGTNRTYFFPPNN